MILVAFVLVLVATVMLIIGTFFNAGVAYIWISIAACVATFVVLGISYAARRRNADAPASRPEPLAEGSSRSAATRPAPRSGSEAPATTAADDANSGADARVTVVPHRPDTAEAHDETRVMDPVTAADEEPTATEGVPESPPAPVWPSAPASVEESAADETTDEPEDVPPAAEERPDTEPAAAAPAGDEQSAAAQQAPRRVAPRRVVRRGAPATPDSAPDADAGPSGSAPAASGTPRVVRRAAPTGERAQTGASARADDAAGRRAQGGDGQQRVVRRVVRRPAGEAPAAATPAAAAPATPAGEPARDAGATSVAGGRSGTRGKRARAVLSEIKGVGPAKQDALLKRFGSLEEMASASVEDLSAVKGVGPSVAQQIKQILSDR